MATAPKRLHKHFQLDPAKIKRAQKALYEAKTADTFATNLKRVTDYPVRLRYGSRRGESYDRQENTEQRRKSDFFHD